VSVDLWIRKKNRDRERPLTLQLKLFFSYYPGFLKLIKY
jgi:hypothetical protein